MVRKTIKKRSPMWYELPILFAIIGGVISYFAIRNDDPIKARRCIYVGIIFSIPIIIMVILVMLFGSSDIFYVISSGSMVPELQVFDVATVDKNYPFEDLQIGDIIVFHRPSGTDRTIIHRIAEIIEEDPLTFRTKGDANPASIPGTDFPITKSEYIGKIGYIIPEAGNITRILTPPINYILILLQFVIFLIPIFLHIKFRRENKGSSNTKDEERKDNSG